MKSLFTVLFIAASFLSTYPQDTIHIPNEYSTIQAGINAANNGDIVLVEDGTYIENINYRGKAITVASRYLVDGDTNHTNNTIIDGSQPIYPDSGSVVTFNSGEDTNSVICGFTITGGTGTLIQGFNFQIGGGINCSLSGARIRNNKIVDNECVIEIADGQAMGGGICAGPSGSSFIIVDSNKIVNNMVWSKGDATSSIDAWGQGGGVALYIDGLVTNNEILSNISKSDHGFAVGGAVRLNQCTVDIIENEIDQNVSVSMQAVGGAGGISCSWANTNISSNSITNNSVFGALYSYGAAIHFDLNSDAYWAIVESNYIANNFSTYANSYGGAISMYTSSPQIINNIITNNSANYGGALYTFENSKPEIINNTIAFNVANHSGGALYCKYVTSNPIFINTIMWNDSAVTSGNEIELVNGGNVTVNYCDITGGWTGEGNINEDPLFLVGDTLFNLSGSSNCIDSGIDSIEINGTWYYAPPFDYDGDPRQSPIGSSPDMGAQESQPATIIINPTELNFGGVLVSSDSTMIFTITNTGNADLDVTDISSNEPAFTMNITNDTIPPGGSQDVEVTFTPTEQKSYNGIIEITSNAIGSPDSVIVTGSGIITGIKDELLNTIPTEFILYQNYPNPFNPKTSIIFGLPKVSEVRLTIFNSLGEEVAIINKGYKSTGYHQVEFDAAELPSGIYFYRLQAGSFIETKKMVLMK